MTCDQSGRLAALREGRVLGTIGYGDGSFAARAMATLSCAVVPRNLPVDRGCALSDDVAVLLSMSGNMDATAKGAQLGLAGSSYLERQRQRQRVRAPETWLPADGSGRSHALSLHDVRLCSGVIALIAVAERLSGRLCPDLRDCARLPASADHVADCVADRLTGGTDWSEISGPQFPDAHIGLATHDMAQCVDVSAPRVADGLDLNRHLLLKATGLRRPTGRMPIHQSHPRHAA